MNKLIPTAVAALLLLTGGASASTLIFSETLTPVSGDSDTTFFDDDNDFSESFDFSSVNYTSIDSFTLTLEASGAANESFFIFNEDWNIRVQGSAAGFADDLFEDIGDGTNTYTITAASDVGAVDVFSNAVATGVFTVWLAETSFDLFIPNPSITVSSLTLEVHGSVTPIPLPAGAALLLGALGGIGAMRMRRKAA